MHKTAYANANPPTRALGRRVAFLLLAGLAATSAQAQLKLRRAEALCGLHLGIPFYAHHSFDASFVGSRPDFSMGVAANADFVVSERFSLTAQLNRDRVVLRRHFETHLPGFFHGEAFYRERHIFTSLQVQATRWVAARPRLRVGVFVGTGPALVEAWGFSVSHTARGDGNPIHYETSIHATETNLETTFNWAVSGGVVAVPLNKQGGQGRFSFRLAFSQLLFASQPKFSFSEDTRVWDLQAGATAGHIKIKTLSEWQTLLASASCQVGFAIIRR